MSFSRIQLQSSRERDRKIYSAAKERRPMGLARVFFSALVLLFAGFMYYVAMHYVPVLSNPRKILRLATETATLPPGTNEFDFEEASAFEKLLGPYYNLFALDRSYMRAGESIQIKYEIPEGTTVQLDIVQCRRVWAIEIFNCDVVSQFSATKTNRKGIASYALGDPGFYHFRHTVNGLKDSDTYQLTWERAVRPPSSEQNMVNKSLRRP